MLDGDGKREYDWLQQSLNVVNDTNCQLVIQIKEMRLKASTVRSAKTKESDKKWPATNTY